MFSPRSLQVSLISLTLCLCTSVHAFVHPRYLHMYAFMPSAGGFHSPVPVSSRWRDVSRCRYSRLDGLLSTEPILRLSAACGSFLNSRVMHLLWHLRAPIRAALLDASAMERRFFVTRDRPGQYSGRRWSIITRRQPVSRTGALCCVYLRRARRTLFLQCRACAFYGASRWTSALYSLYILARFPAALALSTACDAVHASPPVPGRQAALLLPTFSKHGTAYSRGVAGVVYGELASRSRG